MKEVLLPFLTPQALAQFKVLVKATLLHVDILNLRITCSLTEKEIATAINNYSACVIENRSFL